MTHKLYRIITLVVIYVLLHNTVQAEDRYVTDQIMLGVHQAAKSESALVTSIPSGTRVEILTTQGDFSKIKLKNGTSGWVLSSYLIREKPAAAELDDLSSRYQEAAKTATSKERESQLWRDELSNAKTLIKELKKKLANGESLDTIEEATKKTAAAEKENQRLNQEIEGLQAEVKSLRNINRDEAIIKLQEYEKENLAFKTRIAAALANLEGKTVPTPEELASIRPDFPIWFWGLLFLMGVFGLAIGIALMDYRNKRRHGGFRL